MRRMRLGIGLFVVFVVGCGAAGKPAAHDPGGARAPAAVGAASPGTYASSAPGIAAAGALGEGESADAPASATPSAAAASSAMEVAASAPRARPAEAPVAVAPTPARRLPQAGQLTAGVWDDNVNFDFFKPYASGFREANGADFAMFDDQELLSGRGVDAQRGPRSEIDVQLVLDTTGSMGDELSYLQSEFDAIAAKVRSSFPNVTPRWSLVVYRDEGDAYVTREFAFTTDTGRFRRDLRAQSAGGGGDTPEAVVRGLAAGLRQSWRTERDVAKMAFWVADAPAHPGEGRVLADVIRDAKRKGVHVYPVASSDTDPAAEYQMRSAAQMTGGRYLFLTNDSGIGNDHAEPHIPCYDVTRLDAAIVRMIEVELTGRHVAPEPSEIVRSVGSPNKEGKCTLSSGMLVASF